MFNNVSLSLLSNSTYRRRLRLQIISYSALVNNVALPCSIIENHSEIAFVQLPYMKHVFS